MSAKHEPTDYFQLAVDLARQEETRLAFGRALEDYIDFRVGRFEAVQKIAKESPRLPIEEIDRKATEIALKRIERRVRKLDMRWVR